MPTSAPALGIRGAHFTRNGTPTFLYGMSYYGGLAATEATIRLDLNDIQQAGFNWIRVWANWTAFGSQAAAVDSLGRPIPTGLEKLKWLMQECAHRDLFVDVTLTRDGFGVGGQGPSANAAHRQGVETIVRTLREWPNWYLDLSNERNIRDPRHTSSEELRELREAVRQLAPALLVTASHGGDLSNQELRDYLETASVDFISPHRPRDAQSPGQTASKTREYLAWMRELGRTVPILYQEPFRRGYATWNPAASDYCLDLRGAMTGGAAGWCFHNGAERSSEDGYPRRCFDLREKRLFEQLDSEELSALSLLAAIAKARVHEVGRPRTFEER